LVALPLSRGNNCARSCLGVMHKCCVGNQQW
jgi:hypothetical protein